MKKIPESEKIKKYDAEDDLINLKKINLHFKRFILDDLIIEMSQFIKLYNDVINGKELSEEDRELFKLLFETLNNLYSNIGLIINNVYEISEKKHN